MPTTTPNALRYPASTDTPNVPRDLQYIAEDIEKVMAAKLPWFGKPYIENGGAITATADTFNVSVSAGTAVINGWQFAFAASGTLTLPASSTNHIWLTQTLDGNGRHAGYTWTVNQTTAVPANSVYVGQVTTGDGALMFVDKIDASFRGVIAPGRPIKHGTFGTSSSAIAANSAGATAGALTIVGDGVTPIQIGGETPSAYGSVAGGGWGFKIHVTGGASIPTTAGGTGDGILAYSWRAKSTVNHREPDRVVKRNYAAFLGPQTFGLTPWVTNAATVGWDAGAMFAYFDF